VVIAPAHVLQQATQADCPAGLGCQAVAQLVFRLTARGRPPRPVGSSLGLISGPVLCRGFNRFSNCFKFQKSFQTSKICRNL
jgi:hypothetical protein